MDFQDFIRLLECKKEYTLYITKHKKVNLNSPLILLPLIGGGNSFFIDKRREADNKALISAPYVSKASEFLRVLLAHGFYIEKVCDNDKRIHGKMVESVAIAPVEYVRESPPGTQMVIVSRNPKIAKQLNEQLLSLGVRSDNIYTLYDLLDSISDNLRKDLHVQALLSYFDLTPSFDDRMNIQKAFLDILNLMENLVDPKSKDVLLSMLSARYYADCRILLDVADKTQYYPEFFPIRDGEVFIDAGAYIGDTAAEFVSRAGERDYTVHSFEPSPKLYNKLADAVSDNKHVVCHKLGLGKSNETMTFQSTMGGTGKVDFDGDTEIQVVSGDSLNLNPTWIKADIEGYEMEMLEGFQQTIKKYKPRLSICVYHNSYDLWEIPKYIKSLVPEYHFFLRHYCFGMAETVLYAALPGDYSL